ncbi:unnamed protein product [Dovyalis caffra]|uniref:Uncharacterized protein n=1 Tax=Dovyalis caffra TaxID=77055 RepID=A0AAV1RY14_9ROSI|nr:unnamed protein product [Dovyalis caffra]
MLLISPPKNVSGSQIVSVLDKTVTSRVLELKEFRRGNLLLHSIANAVLTEFNGKRHHLLTDTIITTSQLLKGKKNVKDCGERGSNTRPSDLQSDALPTELSPPLWSHLFVQDYSILDLYEATSDVVAANASMVKVESSIFKDYSPIHILTSCDGWLLLSVLKKKMQKLFLFNPFSGEHKGLEARLCFDLDLNNSEAVEVDDCSFLYTIRAVLHLSLCSRLFGAAVPTIVVTMSSTGRIKSDGLTTLWSELYITMVATLMVSGKRGDDSGESFDHDEDEQLPGFGFKAYDYEQ